MTQFFFIMVEWTIVTRFTRHLIRFKLCYAIFESNSYYSRCFCPKVWFNSKTFLWDFESIHFVSWLSRTCSLNHINVLWIDSFFMRKIIRFKFLPMQFFNRFILHVKNTLNRFKVLDIRINLHSFQIFLLH